MKTIAMVCQKGGTGKTTLALSLAVEAVQSGLSVVMVDLDPQVSACEWGDMRRGREAAPEAPVVVDAQPARLANVAAKAREAGVDLLVIDTAGRTEQAAMAAARIADDALLAIVRRLLDGPTEAEFGLELDTEMRRRGASERSFETIIASGPNGAKPHARPGTRRVTPGDLVVIDFGATVVGYRSDMTRTFAVGEPGPDAQRMLDVVTAAQAAGVDAVGAGVAVRGK